MKAAFTRERVSAALGVSTRQLLEEMGGDGFWVGELSSSALSTATAVIAFAQLATADGSAQDEPRIEAGLNWLAAHQNADGGWGDTNKSHSNISTTALVWAAFGAAKQDAVYPEVVGQSRQWLQKACGVDSAGWEKYLAESIRRRYGKDRTFSVPILTACILSGRMGANGWSEVPSLPFELAAFPHGFYGFLQLPVVSYALPALIAIGRAIHRHAPTKNPLLRFLRNRLEKVASRKLEKIQPENGGFLEATPLTSFVLMNLAALGETNSKTAQRAASFLRVSMRPDGSWPIDTNLSTWVTTWAINGLHRQSNLLSYEVRSVLKEWLLGQQYLCRHPYTNAAPGGWAWTDLAGGVPDADDTPGALLALLALGTIDSRARRAGQLGTRWLLGLQNRDGGIPTFCRGWGTLPFDRSGADLTAHTLRSWSAWLPEWQGAFRTEVIKAIQRGLAFLQKQQRPDGTWVPLWFGNQDAPAEENPTWGTARVVLALRELRDRGFEFAPEVLQRGKAALAGLQQADGGWSGGSGQHLESTVEETGVALEALAGTSYTSAVDKGVRWMVERVENGRWLECAPVGFYFAKLWYYERLYPQLTTVAALGAVLQGSVEFGDVPEDGSLESEPLAEMKAWSPFSRGPKQKD
ncbi:MAG: squalene-hopene/tetraprenyl-beta-curcumene cyclase [Verrucomicrobia bacterium]|nr:MAG: squalene-hopene/tetraprenyl-beta-curcumene cyclase [Verrucomicrobiota bacterium]